MKWLLACILFISFAAGGQDCKTLNNFKSFHGVKIGKPFPDSLKKYFEIGSLQQTDTTFDLYDISIENKPSYSRLSKFLLFGDYFESISYFISNKNVYCAMLVKSVNDEDSAYLAVNKNPIFYQNVSAELVSLFGKSTKKERKDITFGEAIIQLWECDKMKIEFGINIYGGGSHYYLTITDINLEKIQKLKKLSE